MLPEDLWPPVPPKAKVWVRTEQEHLDICRGEVLQAHGTLGVLAPPRGVISELLGLT